MFHLVTVATSCRFYYFSVVLCFLKKLITLKESGISSISVFFFPEHLNTARVSSGPAVTNWGIGRL